MLGDGDLAQEQAAAVAGGSDVAAHLPTGNVEHRFEGGCTAGFAPFCTAL